MKQQNELNLNCPMPVEENGRILLAHGGGGKRTHELIENIFLPAFKNNLLETRHDGAVFSVNGQKLAFTTDSYVVRPLFFPGGDIGTLAVNGTVNDLAMCGAKPLYLSAGFILEEGLPIATLQRVVESMKRAAVAAGVELVTGDTKVVDKGKADSLFINTAGIGVVEHPVSIGPTFVRPGDQILLSGDVGRHGMAIMAVREGLEFETTIKSDCAPLIAPVKKLLEEGIRPSCLRDLTRGGLASALVEIAEASGFNFQIEENLIPVLEEVRGACEILGLDPLYVANEGRFILFVPAVAAKKALEILRSFHPQAQGIGSVSQEKQGLVTMKSRIGVNRLLDMLSGEQLPRIC